MRGSLEFRRNLLPPSSQSKQQQTGLLIVLLRSKVKKVKLFLQAVEAYEAVRRPAPTFYGQ
jgi:hypothetical protein